MRPPGKSSLSWLQTSSSILRRALDSLTVGFPGASTLNVSVRPDTGPDPAKLAALAAEVLVVDATSFARQAGDVRAQNLAMVGGLVGTGWLPLDAATVERILTERFSDEMLRLNREAFRLGHDGVRQRA